MADSELTKAFRRFGVGQFEREAGESGPNIEVASPRIELSEEQKHKLYMDRGYYDYLLELLQQTELEYVPNIAKDYYLEILLAFQPDSKFISQMRDSKSDGVYKEPEFRKCLCTLLQEHKDILVYEGEQEANKIFLKNMHLNPKLIQFFRKEMKDDVHLRYPISSVASAPVEIYGSFDGNKFRERLTKYCSPDKCLGLITYINAIFRDESFSHKNGRGTAGAAVQLMFGNKRIYAVLTAAHVPFGWLANYEENEFRDRKEPTELFNRSFSFGTYVRSETCDMDYAFVPCSNAFSPNELSLAKREVFKINGEELSFGRASDIAERWKTLMKKCTGFMVYKRGIATQETCGEIVDLDEKKCIVVKGDRFSAAGDSGSLVLFRDGDYLYPVGVHYAGIGSGKSAFVPLWRICYDFCKKQEIDGFSMSFLNPQLKGELEFKLSQFSDCK